MAEKEGFFSGQPASEILIRLRSINSDTKTRSQPWSTDDLKMTLHELKFTPQKHLILEKQINGRFPGDDDLPDMVIKIVRFEPRGEIFAPPVEIKLKIDSSLLDLKQAIESLDSLCSIATKDQRLFFLSTQDAAAGLPKEIVPFGLDAKLEDLASVRLTDLQLFDGATVHLEQRTEGTNDSFVIKKFEEERNKIQLFYNHPDSRELNLEIFVDKRKTVEQLKALIASLVGVSIDEFKLCNGLLAKEFREEQKTLEQVGLYDGSAVFLQKGKPISANKTKLTVYLLEEAVSQDASMPPQLNQRDVLSELISAELTIGDLRSHLLVACSSVPSIADVQDVKRLRLREKKAGRAANILQDKIVISKIGMSGANAQPKESIELFLQVLPQPETVKETEMILDIRRWFPQKQELAERATEVVLPRDSTIFQLKSLLATPHNIPIQFVCIAKPFAYQLKKKDQLHTIAALNWNVDDASGLTKSPWYLQDGDCLVFKDDREPEILPEASGESGSGPGKRSFERSLQIRTFYDEEAEIQAAIEASMREASSSS